MTDAAQSYVPVLIHNVDCLSITSIATGGDTNAVTHKIISILLDIYNLGKNTNT